MSTNWLGIWKADIKQLYLWLADEMLWQTGRQTDVMFYEVTVLCTQKVYRLQKSWDQIYVVGEKFLSRPQKMVNFSPIFILQ